jgi:hypothetical protein
MSDGVLFVGFVVSIKQKFHDENDNLFNINTGRSRSAVRTKDPHNMHVTQALTTL